MAQHDSSTGRRKLLQGAAAASGALILKPATVFGTQANSAIELGLIGCGSRGTWIVQFFQEHGARITALADLYQNNLGLARDKFKVDRARCFRGPRAFREMAQAKVDGIVMEVPPYFFPAMATAAVEAGKPVYLAKPVAVDVPGCQIIRACGEKAKARNISFWVDFQIRASAAYLEAAERVRRGDIGDMVFGQTAFLGHWQPLRERAAMSREEHRVRNWYNDLALGGGIVVNRDIHNLDGANMYLGTNPLQAYGTGARKASIYPGDCFDHYLITYWYPRDFKLELCSADFLWGYGHIILKIHGSKGTLDTQYNGAVRITGQNAWPGVEKDPTMNAGTSRNARTFVESIRAGRPVNNVPASVDSTLTGILGQMAAHQGRLVTWEEMLRSTQRYEFKLAG